MIIDKDLTETLEIIKHFHPTVQSEVTKDYYDKYFHISENGSLRRLFAYVQEKNKIESLKNKFAYLISAIEKVTNYIIFHEPEILHRLNLNKLDLDALRKKNKDTFIPYCRIDTVLSQGTYKVLEVNTRRPQMYEDADWFENVYNNNDIEKENNTVNIAKAIKRNFQLNMQREAPKTVILLSNILKGKYSFSLYRQLKNKFPNTKIIACSRKTLYSRLRYEGNILFYKNYELDLIVIQSKTYYGGTNSFFSLNGNITNPLIAEAYRRGAVEIFTPPSSLIAGSKLLFDIMRDVRILDAAELNNDEVDSLKLLATSYSYEDLGDRTKDQLVIKINQQGQGKGVILGTDLTIAEWKEKIQFLHDSHFDFIMQERLEFEMDTIFDYQTKSMRPAYVTLEPFVINTGKYDVTGFSTRAIIEDEYERGMKFNPAYDKDHILFGHVVEYTE